ncbi:MAG TPA: DUF835 domain-containing protein [Thermoplasmata archaeon]
MDISEFLSRVLPTIIGFLVLAYFAIRINRVKQNFLRTVRSWIVIAFVVALAAQWILELLAALLGGWFADLRPTIETDFMIAEMWLAVCLVALLTRYSRYDDIVQFAKWIKGRPINIITVWGLAGLVLIVITAIEHPEASELLNKSQWMLYATVMYIIFSIAIQTGLASVRKHGGGYAGLTRQTTIGFATLPIVWTGIVAVEFAVDLLLDMAAGYEEYDFSSWAVLVLFAAMVRITLATGFVAIVIDPETESVRREGFRDYDIPRGAYLIHDEKPESAFELFSDLISMPLRPDAAIPGEEESAAAALEFLITRGLVVTRDYPDKIREKHKLQVTPIIWLTESPGEMRVAPTSLAVLSDTIVRFMESNPNSIVLVDGIEYISTYNEFKKVLKTLDILNETAWVTRSRLLIAVHPSAYDGKDLALLERDRRVVRGTEGVAELKRESRVFRTGAQ